MHNNQKNFKPYLAFQISDNRYDQVRQPIGGTPHRRFAETLNRFSPMISMIVGAAFCAFSIGTVMGNGSELVALIAVAIGGAFMFGAILLLARS